LENGTINLAVPTGQDGSGLTILVGPNNAGKSTILEALIAATQSTHQSPTFSEGQRNTKAAISIKLTDTNGEVRCLSGTPRGGAVAQVVGSNWPDYNSVYHIPSRRQFPQHFGQHSTTPLDNYKLNYQRLNPVRGSQLQFHLRMAEIFGSAEEFQSFNSILRDIDPVFPDWFIEQSDSGNQYVKCQVGSYSHSSDGLGEGLISLMVIADALLTSRKGHIVTIDEPELSLHPSLQRSILSRLKLFSRDRQFLISTHSPLFIDWQSISAGAAVIRVARGVNGTELFPLTDQTRAMISSITENINNPHILGLDANETFFIDDGVVIVEGQEDVILYKHVFQQLNVPFSGKFFGWGAGGAGNVKLIAKILTDFGFKKVAIVLDGDKQEDAARLRKEFPNYIVE